MMVVATARVHGGVVIVASATQCILTAFPWVWEGQVDGNVGWHATATAKDGRVLGRGGHGQGHGATFLLATKGLFDAVGQTVIAAAEEVDLVVLVVASVVVVVAGVAVATGAAAMAGEGFAKAQETHDGWSLVE